MHILLVHQYFLSKNDAGGSRWNQFSKYWSQKGCTVTVLAGTVHYASGKKAPQYRGKYVVREKESEHVAVLRCHVSERYNRNFAGRLWAYFSFFFSTLWAGLFHAGKCDVIICTSPPLTVGLTGCILSKLKRVPMVFEVRDLWPESAIDTGVLTNKWLIKLSYWLERISYKSASWINVLTPAFEESLVKNKAVDPERISMIPNGADMDIFLPGERDNWVREKYGIENKFVITYVGAHGVANHLSQLIDVAEKIKDDPDIVIMLVGDGMQKEMLEQNARQRGLNNVLFVDSVPKTEIVDYVAASDICTAVLKKVDTFKTVYPNKIFDYMSACRPIILAIDGVARELLENAGSGMYAAPENTDAFVRAIYRFKEDPEFCQQCGKSGLEYVAGNFSRETLAVKYYDILVDKVAGKKKQSAVLK